MKLVDDTVEASVRHVRAFVHQYLSARLAEARAPDRALRQPLTLRPCCTPWTPPSKVLLPVHPRAHMHDTA